MRRMLHSVGSENNTCLISAHLTDLLNGCALGHRKDKLTWEMLLGMAFVF